MRETKSPGDTIDHGTRTSRYAMIGDTYMHFSQVDERAELLWVGVRRMGKPEWLTETVLRLHLAEMSYVGEKGWAQASMILAKADVTWSDICRMKS